MYGGILPQYLHRHQILFWGENEAILNVFHGNHKGQERLSLPYSLDTCRQLAICFQTAGGASLNVILFVSKRRQCFHKCWTCWRTIFSTNFTMNTHLFQQVEISVFVYLLSLLPPNLTSQKESSIWQRIFHATKRGNPPIVFTELYYITVGLNISLYFFVAPK